MNQAIRAVLFDERDMVDRIITSLPELSQTFGLNSLGHVAFYDIKSFNEKFQTLYKQNIESQMAENEAPGKKVPRASRGNKLQRWLKLWLPFDARMVWKQW